MEVSCPSFTNTLLQTTKLVQILLFFLEDMLFFIKQALGLLQAMGSRGSWWSKGKESLAYWISIHYAHVESGAQRNNIYY